MNYIIYPSSKVIKKKLLVLAKAPEEFHLARNCLEERKSERERLPSSLSGTILFCSTIRNIKVIVGFPSSYIFFFFLSLVRCKNHLFLNYFGKLFNLILALARRTNEER